jgi:hypothetical protein
MFDAIAHANMMLKKCVYTAPTPCETGVARSSQRRHCAYLFCDISKPYSPCTRWPVCKPTNTHSNHNHANARRAPLDIALPHQYKQGNKAQDELQEVCKPSREQYTLSSGHVLCRCIRFVFINLLVIAWYSTMTTLKE